MSQQAAALGPLKLHSHKSIPRNRRPTLNCRIGAGAIAHRIGNAVVLTQPSILERVVRIDQVVQATVLADNVVQECSRLAEHRFAKFLVELRKQLGIGRVGL